MNRKSYWRLKVCWHLFLIKYCSSVWMWTEVLCCMKTHCSINKRSQLAVKGWILLLQRFYYLKCITSSKTCNYINVNYAQNVSNTLHVPLYSYVKEASGDWGPDPYKHLEWSGLLEVDASWDHQGAAESQPCFIQAQHEHHVRGQTLPPCWPSLTSPSLVIIVCFNPEFEFVLSHKEPVLTFIVQLFKHY